MADLVPALTPEQIGALLMQTSMARRGGAMPRAGGMRVPTGINNLTAQGDRPRLEVMGQMSPSIAGGGGFRVQADGMGGMGEGGGGNTQFVPMMYLDPLFDPILIVFPQDNIRELNRRQRHYDKYQPWVRAGVDFHTETPLSDFDLRCPRHQDAQDYFNDFKERTNLFDHVIDLTRDHWLLGEGFTYGNWDEMANEFSSFVQFPPEEIEIHSAYVLPERVYVLRPNRDLDKLQTSPNPADRRLQELMQQYNPGYADALRQNKPFILDSNRLIVMQRKRSGYANRGVSLLMAALKDLLYEDYLNLFRMVFLQRHCTDKDSDILTINGFKNVSEVKVGDSLASFNPGTKRIEYHPATAMHSYDYDGNMVKIEGVGCDLMVTPEHKVWMKECVDGQDVWRFEEAQNVKPGTIFLSADGLTKTEECKVSSVRSVPYQDKVYCPTVPPHHLIVVRRNKKVVVTGQSFPLKIFKVGCFSEDTDLLTADGFKSVTEIMAGDLIATFNPETEKIEYHPATKMNIAEYEGDMINFKTNHCDLLVTPEHRMWAMHYTQHYDGRNDWHFKEARKIRTGLKFRSVAGWTGSAAPESVQIGEIKVPIDAFLELAGYFVSEGHTHIRPDGYAMAISQSQKSTTFNEKMDALVVASGLPFRRHSRTNKPATTGLVQGVECKMYDWKIDRKVYVEYFREQFGHKSFAKHVPAWIKMLPSDKLNIFLEAAILGDGSQEMSAKGFRRLKYHTSSRQLADDIQEIALKVGYYSTAMLRETRGMQHQAYLVNINVPDGHQKKGGRYPHIVSRKQIKKVPYKGKVYCPTVPPHHLVFAKRNGRIVITGQSIERGFIPPARFYHEFRRLLNQAANDPNFSIVTHPFITTEIVTGHDKTIALQPLYDLVKSRVLTAMFVSEAVISGEKTPFASGITFMRGLMQKYLTFRNNLSNELNRKVFINLSRMRRFYYPTTAEVDHRVITRRADRLVVPEIGWQKANLMGNQQIMQMLVQLRKDGDAPLKPVLEMFGFDFDDMMEQMKREEGTYADPVLRDVRKKYATGDKKSAINDIGKRLMLGERVADTLRENLGGEVQTPDEAAARKKNEEFNPPEVEGPRGEVEPPMAFRPPEATTKPPFPAEGPGEAQPRPVSETETTPGAEAV